MPLLALSARPGGRPNGRPLAQTLRRRILRHELPPGTALREQALAEEFGVSRQLVREALAELEGRGLVERGPHRGAAVRRYTLADYVQMMEVREVLEGLGARLAARNAPPGGWDDLAAQFGAPLEAAIAAGELELYLDQLETLRRRMRDAAASESLATTLAGHEDRTAMVMRRLVLVTDRSSHALAEHRGVLAALAAGDGEAAEAAKRRQIRSATRALERYWALVQ